MADETIEDLLLDYVRGRCSSNDKRRVEDAAQRDPMIAAELAFLEQLADTIKSDSQPGSSPEFGWARLSKSIDAEQRTPASRQQSLVWRYAAMILGAIALGQTAMLTTVASNKPDQAVYAAASEETSSYVLRVVFAPSATEEALRTLLLSVQGEITSGPSAIGLYEVKFANDEAVAHARATFEDASSLVESVNTE